MSEKVDWKTFKWQKKMVKRAILGGIYLSVFQVPLYVLAVIFGILSQSDPSTGSLLKLILFLYIAAVWQGYVYTRFTESKFWK